MIAVIFEVWPADGRRGEYLDLAASLRPLLADIDGFVSIERFESLTTPGKLLSLSLWRDEAALMAWRNVAEHRVAQALGRQGIFHDYRLRVATVARDYGMTERAQAPEDSRSWHDRGTGVGTTGRHPSPEPPNSPAMSEPQPNALATAELVVGPNDLASSLVFAPGDEFPPVFATARMIALMEVACARHLVPMLEPGQMSVGVTVDVTHTAPTPPGARVVATARYVGREGKLFVFEVVAHDPGGEIGKGTHKRAIVTTERILAGAARRGG